MATTSNLSGKIAVVTGAGQGLGESIASLLAARGATVIVTDVNQEEGNRVAETLAGDAETALFHHLDVSQEAGWVALVEMCRERFGRVDILVNNAGLIDLAPLNEMPVDMFDRSMAVNARGTFLGCKSIFPAMCAAGGGAIVNISSVSGLIANVPGFGAYSASKAAVRLLTKAAAIDYAPHRIRVNSVHPGTIATPATQAYLDDPELRPLVLGRTPMARPADPDEIARTVAFLASGEAAYMTGSELVVDGGWTAC